jgi:hypothetical protein
VTGIFVNCNFWADALHGCIVYMYLKELELETLACTIWFERGKVVKMAEEREIELGKPVIQTTTVGKRREKRSSRKQKTYNVDFFVFKLDLFGLVTDFLFFEDLFSHW